MITFFAYLGATMIWLGQQFYTRSKKQDFKEILFGGYFTERKYQAFPIVMGMLLIVLAILSLVLSAFDF